MRAALRIAGILLALLVCYPLHRLWTVLRRPSPWPRRFLRAVGRIAGLRVAMAGRPAAAPVLLVANHVSWLDILALAGATGTAFVAKAEIAGWPLIGRLATINGTIFVARAERGAVRDQAAQLRAALGGDRPATLFAEGTTGDGRAVKPFRASLFAAVAGGTVPVQPVAIDYYDPAAVLWPEGEPAGRNALRLLARPGRITVTLHFLPPLASAGVDRKRLAQQAELAVAGALAQGDRPAAIV